MMVNLINPGTMTTQNDAINICMRSIKMTAGHPAVLCRHWTDCYGDPENFILLMHPCYHLCSLLKESVTGEGAVAKNRPLSYVKLLINFCQRSKGIHAKAAIAWWGGGATEIIGTEVDMRLKR